MVLKFLSVSIKDVLKCITDKEFTFKDFYFYIPNVGYIQVDGIRILSNGIKVSNHKIQNSHFYNFDDKLFIKI